jgi:hypothetical protein
LLNDLVTTAPAPARYRRPKISREIPKMPEASMVGLSKVSVPIEVEMLGFTLNTMIIFSYNS